MKILTISLLVAASLSANQASAEWVRLEELTTINVSIETKSIQMKKGIVKFQIQTLEPDKKRFPTVAKIVNTIEINCKAEMIRSIDEVQYDLKGKTAKGQNSDWQKIAKGTAFEAVHYRVCP